MTPDAVIKVGGSLLDWPELPTRLSSYLNARRDERLVLIPGGGPAADIVRTLDRIHALGDERAHQLALQALDLAAHAFAALVDDLRAVDSVAQLVPTWNSRQTPVLAPGHFLSEDERCNRDPLPHTWEVTSDSIAAHVARRLGARELVLLKSAPLPQAGSIESAARSELVDPYFPAVAGQLDRVILVNLRDPSASPLCLERSLDDR